jgi:cytochrome P450
MTRSSADDCLIKALAAESHQRPVSVDQRLTVQINECLHTIESQCSRLLPRETISAIMRTMQESGTILPPKYDPHDAAMMDDPYPTYARLRQAGRLCRGGPGQWVATHYADVAALLHDSRLAHQFPERYREFSFGDGAAKTFFERIILNRDPPSHTRLRQIMSTAFSPALVRRLGDSINRLVDEMLAPVLDQGYFDAVLDLAFPLPAMVICELIGIPLSDRNVVRPRATDLCKLFGTQIPASDQVAANQALAWLRQYIGDLLEARRQKPSSDFLSTMLAAASGQDAFNHEEVVDNVLFLFFAGFETTMNLISTGCAALLRRPDEMARLRADASLVPTAVEEFLRYDAPIQSMGRFVQAPIEIGGRTIKKGRVLILLLGSANHDEKQFHQPERLDVGRKPNPHVSFGGGFHHCLGATLARLEASVIFLQLSQRFSVFEPAAPPIRQPSAGFRSYASVPIAVRPA